MLTDKRDRNIINLKHTKIMSDEISKEEIKSEFLKTAGSFAEYMMKEYGQPKDGRSMLLLHLMMINRLCHLSAKK